MKKDYRAGHSHLPLPHDSSSVEQGDQVGRTRPVGPLLVGSIVRQSIGSMAPTLEPYHSASARVSNSSYPRRSVPQVQVSASSFNHWRKKLSRMRPVGLGRTDQGSHLLGVVPAFGEGTRCMPPLSSTGTPSETLTGGFETEALQRFQYWGAFPSLQELSTAVQGQWHLGQGSLFWEGGAVPSKGSELAISPLLCSFIRDPVGKLWGRCTAKFPALKGALFPSLTPPPRPTSSLM